MHSTTKSFHDRDDHSPYDRDNHSCHDRRAKVSFNADDLATLKRALHGAQQAYGRLNGAEHAKARQALADLLEDLGALCRSTGATTFGRTAGARP